MEIQTKHEEGILEKLRHGDLVKPSSETDLCKSSRLEITGLKIDESKCINSMKTVVRTREIAQINEPTGRNNDLFTPKNQRARGKTTWW